MSFTDVATNFDQSCRRNFDGVCEHCGRALDPWDWFICPRLLNPHYQHVDQLETQKPMGLGDYTEALLKSVGVTQDRYNQAKELFGLTPTCGCSKRKEWLNRVSDWWQGRKPTEETANLNRTTDIQDGKSVPQNARLDLKAAGLTSD